MKNINKAKFSSNETRLQQRAFLLPAFKHLLINREACSGHHLWHFSLQVLLKSNRIDVLLSRLLPHGQLLFLNHRFAQSLEKEVAAYMAK